MRLSKKKLQIRTLDRWAKLSSIETELENRLYAQGFSDTQIQDVLKKFRKLFPKIDKWYESVKVEWSIPKKKYEVKLVKKTAAEIGENLEDLVHAALQKLGCKVNSNSLVILNAPCNMKDDGAFKDKKFVFMRHPRTKNMVDFEGQNVKIAIEVKNWDPTISKSDEVVRNEICKRFKKIRKKVRYLLIPESHPNRGFPFTKRQKEMLRQRRIQEINLRAQLKWDNEKDAYKDVFSKIKQILSIHKKNE